MGSGEMVKRIVIFNVNWLGDVLFSTAVIRNIRYNFPHAFISCIVPGRCYLILEGNPYLNEIIIFDEKKEHKGLLGQLRFIRMLKKKKFDTAFLLHRSFTRALICRLAGIEERIGYYTRKRSFLLSGKIIPPDKHAVHRMDYYLNIIRQAGLEVKDRHTDFFIHDEDVKYVDEFLSGQGVKKGELLVVMNPGGNWLPKRWPRESWSRLADKLISDLKAKVVITGAKFDCALASKIKQGMQFNPVIACGHLNIKQLGALCRKADVFITADSGPLHVASVVGAKKIIALFGPTLTDITGPRPLNNTIILQKDVGCLLPCYQAHCSDNRCMKAISVDEVFSAIRAPSKTLYATPTES